MQDNPPDRQCKILVICSYSYIYTDQEAKYLLTTIWTQDQEWIAIMKIKMSRGAHLFYQVGTRAKITKVKKKMAWVLKKSSQDKSDVQPSSVDGST